MKQCRIVNVLITFCLTLDLFVKDPGRISCNRKQMFSQEYVVMHVLNRLVSVPLSTTIANVSVEMESTNIKKKPASNMTQKFQRQL